MKKFIGILIAAVLCAAVLIGTARKEQPYKISDGNRINFGTLLADMLEAYESGSYGRNEKLDSDLVTIRTVSYRDYAVARSIEEHWERVYLDPEYRLSLYREGAKPDLDYSMIPNSASHAFVVLGYELKDGEMTEELKGRCNAAAAAAKAFPKTVLVCSGGATGANNPDRHTEAGMMKAYLSGECGISPDRIFTDEQAMTTAENAVNTLAILKEHGVRTMTIVTSSYHQRWGQVLYNAVSALYEQQYGYAPEIIGNYCYDISPETEAFRNDASIAISQLGSILGVQRQTPRRS